MAKFDPHLVLDEFIAFAEKEGVKKEGNFDAKADSTMLARIKKNVPGLKADDPKLKEFQEYARKTVAREYAKGYDKSLPTILEQLKARIASNQWQNEGFYRVINQSSKEIESAIKAINGKEYSKFKLRE